MGKKTTDQEPTCYLCNAVMPASGAGAKLRRFCGLACKQAYHRQKHGSQIAKREKGEALEWCGTRHEPSQEHPVCTCGCGQPVKKGKTVKYLKYAGQACRKRASRRKERS